MAPPDLSVASLRSEDRQRRSQRGHTVARPDLSIVILNFNTREHLRAGLLALLGEGSTTVSTPEAAIKAEVIVVDNASSDGSAEMVEAAFPWVRLVRSPRNGGFAYGNNQALRTALGREAVLLLNPDAEVSPGALGRLLGALRAHPEAGVVGPRLLRADGSLHLACRRSFPSPLVSFYRLAGLARAFPRSPLFGRYNLTHLDPDQPGEVDSVCGACMLVRREALDQVGGLDERFFMYGEDLDWCWRMREAGWTVRYAPAATVQHQHGGASRTRPVRTTLAFFQAMDLFYRKHYARRYNPAISALVRLGILAGLGAAMVRLALAPRAVRRIGL